LKRSFYVIFNRSGFVRATKGEGIVKAKELQVQINLNIPDKAFTQPQFKANLTIREDQLPDIVQEFDVELLRLKEGTDEEAI